MLRRFVRFLIAVALAGASGAAAVGRAQTPAPAPPAARTPDEPVCLGFSFGTWKPALDWRAAGHGAFPDSTNLQHAPDGRDWAADLDEPDSSMVLYPAWWPVGVSVRLPTRSPAFGDTVSGIAIAYRAVADSASPKASVRAWRVRCGR
jgi:hypothetical protein